MDEIAELIGAKPNLWHLTKTDSALALRCYFGPCLPAQYRLMGPGAWGGAADTIRYIFTYAQFQAQEYACAHTVTDKIHTSAHTCKQMM